MRHGDAGQETDTGELQVLGQLGLQSETWSQKEKGQLPHSSCFSPKDNFKC